ncbi:uncharacterized protein LOC106663639 isoform X2 [Cimex lectularius]|uniref:F-box domain-containing protein n=1 Tax=Cimex lectularius TaxID=79782 RepID=A0A8I6RDX1_CIMLE|nr:uncharacterized protein LOC106663639 isoform X2 [Cimex lectularius]
MEEQQLFTEEDDQSPWCSLPDIIMEQVFSYLNVRERYYSSMVCRRWRDAFYLPYVWSIFTFEESTLTRRRFNYYSGWQFTLDHLRAQLCLGTVGRHFRVLIFSPMTNFYNMYEFMNMVSYYTEQQGADKFTVKGVGKNIHTLRYTFPCRLLSGDDENQQLHVYGTGGKLLAAVKRLMGNLKKLRRLELIDLMLDSAEAQTLLDDVCSDCCTTLKFLSIINFTKGQCQLIHVGVFLNLRVLVLSPQNIGEDALELLSYTKLRHLHLAQTRLTPSSAVPLSPKAWKLAAKRNTDMRIHLTLSSKIQTDIIWQEEAPVSTVLFDSPHCKLEPEILTRVTLWYKKSLTVFGYLGLPKYSQPKSFKERIDPLLLMLIKDCTQLETLIVRERISTATILLIVDNGPSLKNFFVRRNAVILRCDWPRNPSWDSSYYSWLRNGASSYDQTEKEVSKCFGYKWQMLSDKEFKKLDIRLY